MISPYDEWTPTLPTDCFVAPNASVIGNVELGAQSSVWFNSVVRGDVHEIRIGTQTNIQDLSLLHVSYRKFGLYIGNQVTVGHRVVLHGCKVGDRCLIGIGSIILDGAVIGSDTIIGAGSVVTPGSVIPSGTLALGIPAKPKRDLTDAERQNIAANAAHYVILGQKYLKG